MIKASQLTRIAEYAIFRYFEIRTDLIVPNVTPMSHLVSFEVDMLVLSKSGYAHGFEIKVSESDLKADLKKKQYSKNDFELQKSYYKKFKTFSYVVTEAIKETALQILPPWMGVYTLDATFKRMYLLRAPTELFKYKWTDKEQCKLARLGSMRLMQLAELRATISTGGL